MLCLIEMKEQLVMQLYNLGFEEEDSCVLEEEEVMTTLVMSLMTLTRSNHDDIMRRQWFKHT